MKKLLLASLLAATSFNSFAYIPSAPSSPTGYDEIRTAEGTTCRSSVGGNLQLHGGFSNGTNDNYYEGPHSNSNQDEKFAYVGVAYSFGGGKRLNCNRLAEIETERAQLELQKLKSEIKALEKIRELNMLESTGNLPKLSRNN